MAQSPWVNDDGLVIKFGTEEAASLGSGGHVAGHFAGEQICEVNLDLEDVTTSAAVFNYGSILETQLASKDSAPSVPNRRSSVEIMDKKHVAFMMDPLVTVAQDNGDDDEDEEHFDGNNSCIW